MELSDARELCCIPYVISLGADLGTSMAKTLNEITFIILKEKGLLFLNSIFASSLLFFVLLGFALLRIYWLERQSY